MPSQPKRHRASGPQQDHAPMALKLILIMDISEEHGQLKLTIAAAKK